jgi:hypothetical protein
MPQKVLDALEKLYPAKNNAEMHQVQNQAQNEENSYCAIS